ncbi:hypothetical protein PCASD_17912 [Puccinia coronata f. sp. avenae]|uniref:CFEM domain-containing protein n=1 Tax=Puccinia coronata f. sp. avenae TaxID=200324 RepID=A0A2N5TJV1_9BASI|nr:hypothetical protein PCASD_17912 [Puccinia coronata f. sp. avenae]
MLSSNTLRFLTLFAVLASAPAIIDAAAQINLSGLPQCGMTCLGSVFTAGKTKCAMSDFACICKDLPFLGSAAECYSQQCSDADKLSALKWGKDTCASVGVPLPDNPAQVAGGAAPPANGAPNGPANAPNNTGSAPGGNYSTSPPSPPPTGSPPASGTGAAPQPPLPDSAAVVLSAASIQVFALVFTLVSSFLII